MEKLFAQTDRQLEKAGVVLKRETMLHATAIETVAASRTAAALRRMVMPT